MPEFFWQWTPVNLADRSVFFHVNADQDGTPWNTRAVIAPDGTGRAASSEHAQATMEAAPAPRHALACDGTIGSTVGDERFEFEPLGRFQMRGLGYTSPKWNHGLDHGTLEVEREDIDLGAVDPATARQSPRPAAVPRQRPARREGSGCSNNW